MLLIACPYCGEREEREFHCGGEAHIERPEDPEALDDAAWASYLFYRGNPMGLQFERWQHIYGCRQWFNVARDTRSHEILRVYRMGEPRPDPEP